MTPGFKQKVVGLIEYKLPIQLLRTVASNTNDCSSHRLLHLSSSAYLLLMYRQLCRQMSPRAKSIKVMLCMLLTRRPMTIGSCTSLLASGVQSKIGSVGLLATTHWPSCLACIRLWHLKCMLSLRSTYTSHLCSDCRQHAKQNANDEWIALLLDANSSWELMGDARYLIPKQVLVSLRTYADMACTITH